MKWFYIKFTNIEVSTQQDEAFVRAFVKLLHNHKHPDRLGLYKLKFHINDGMVFYVSAPIELSYHLKSVLAHFPAEEVSRPNLNVLELVLGKNGILEIP
ncbi:MAG: hypothetical protein MUF28_03470 [Ignavibacterium sp.]|jgi:hypothetical protein|nr:hypothetical protein [Ignavibacterium sp.]